MPKIKFTPNLKQFFPTLTALEVEGRTVSEIVYAANQEWDGLIDYILDEHGRVRQHVNIFVNQELIQDQIYLSDTVEEDHIVFIMQALSGG